MAVLCAAAESRVTGKKEKKKERKKEKTAIKLKAFRLTSGCLIRIEKDEHWTTSWKRREQLVRSNTLQEAVDHGGLSLQQPS